MKSPICEVCLKSEILCSACQEKINTGQLQEKDVEILNLLYKESRKNKSLADVEIKRIVEGQDLILIVCSNGSGRKIVGRGGFLAKQIEGISKKPVRIVEESSDPRSFLQNIVQPVPIINLNVLYSPQGEKYRIIIPRNSRLPMPLKVFQSISKEVLKKDVEIGFE